MQNKAIINIIFFFIIIFSLNSCISQKRIKYVQDKASQLDTINEYLLKRTVSNTIQPYDELYIRVIGFDEQTYKFFNFDATTSANMMGNNSSLIGYMVNDSGYIDFPIVGKIFLKDYSLEEAKDTIKKELTTYVNQVDVIVKFLNRNVTVLGEVKSPGRISIGREQITILDAIGLAGDLTDYANRNKITIIREDDNKAKFYYVDITTKDIVGSELYYIKPNDILYVEPLEAKYWGIKPSPPETVMTYITWMTTLITMYLFIKSL